jgi:hypothetical protein
MWECAQSGTWAMCECVSCVWCRRLRASATRHCAIVASQLQVSVLLGWTVVLFCAMGCCNQHKACVTMCEHGE